jgi:hypothetical protein
VRHEDIPEINNPKIRFPVLLVDSRVNSQNNLRISFHLFVDPDSFLKDSLGIYPPSLKEE